MLDELRRLIDEVLSHFIHDPTLRRAPYFYDIVCGFHDSRSDKYNGVLFPL